MSDVNEISSEQALCNVVNSDSNRLWHELTLRAEVCERYGKKVSQETIKRYMRILCNLGMATVIRGEDRVVLGYKGIAPFSDNKQLSYPQWFCKYFTIIIIGYWAITSLLG